MTFMPNPDIAVGSKAGGKPAPSSETESEYPPDMERWNFIMILPAPCLTAFMTNSLRINPKDTMRSVGNSASTASTAMW